ncbi:MAG: class I SAM-dependent DNA methyltransferase, partial [Comamonas sp.]|nr:class I SAM-dependent DNA methyltransferase [Comamonas sp.]
IAYRELRRLEHELIERLFFVGKDRGLLDISTLSHVSVSQFYGIEIDASAAHIAQVALWITDLQLNIEAASRFGTTRPSVPLAHSAHIHHGNALQTDWAQVLPPAQCSFIVGNPPFVGSTYRSKEQTADAERVTGHIPSWGLLDFVACWHVQATAYMQANPAIRTALVSTNSICQGQQVPILWAHLLAQGVHIHFAHRTFQWSNEGKGVAAVHCIILGFALQAPATAPRVFDYSANIQGEPEEATAKYINPYLVDAPAVLVDKRRKPLQAFVKEMANGGKPTEGGNLLLTQDEADSIRTSDSIAAQYIRPYLMGDEFINNKPRYCLWLTEANSADKANSPELKQRLAAVRQMRESSKKPATQKLADTPHLFGEIRQPSSDTYLAIPKVSSERRRFIPIGFLSKEVICGDKIFFVDQAGLYHLGILSSTMHNAWMRTVAGRLKSDYSYSNTIVYNNYPWPQTISDKQQAAIETAAQAVLDARALEFARCAKAGQACSLALLYNPDTMPTELVQAHIQLDRAVDAAYAYKGGKDDAPRVAFLFGLYQQLAAPLDTPAAKKASRRKKSAE